MTTVQPAGDVVERLREPENLVRILIWRDYEDARSEGPFDPLKIEAADTIEALRSRLLAAERALEPFNRIADDIPSSFSDETVVSIGIDHTLSAEQVADIQGMSGGTIKSDRATIVLSMACMQASHFRAARSALEAVPWTPNAKAPASPWAEGGGKSEHQDTNSQRYARGSVRL